MSERLFSDGLNAAMEKVLPSIYATYKDRLPGANVRAYEIAVDSDLEMKAPTLWAKRYLGPCLPPLHKIDGHHPSITRDKHLYSRQWDGVWDFTEFGALLVRFTGVYDPEANRTQLVTFVLANEDSDIHGLSKHLDRIAKRLQLRHRSIASYGSGAPSMRIDVDADDVMLRPGLRDDLLADIENFIAGRRWYKQNGLLWKRSTLLHGEPGTGKTTIGKMLASAFLNKRRQVFSMVVDRKTDFADIRHVFSITSQAKPAMLLLEDIESVQQANISRSAFLNVLDGVGFLREGVFLVATTNYPGQLDPALINRPGRFDRVIEVTLPSAQLRRAYLARKWAGTPQERLIEVAAQETADLSLASLNELHYSVLMVVRAGNTPSEGDVRKIARELRSVGKKTESGKWRSDEERVVGFAPSRSWTDGEGEDATVALTDRGRRGDD